MKPANQREGKSVKKTHFSSLWIMTGRVDAVHNDGDDETFQFRLDTQSFIMRFDGETPVRENGGQDQYVYDAVPIT